VLKIRWRRGLVVGAAAGLLALALTGTGLFRRFELKSWDARMELFADPAKRSAEIALVLVDQYSLDLYAGSQGWSWPWPREIYSYLVRYLASGGAKAVFFDFALTETSRSGPEDDAALAAAMAEAGNVVLPVFLSAEDKPSAADRVALLRKFSADAPPGLVSKEMIRSATLPLPELLGRARAVGNIRFIPDEDTVFRRLPLWHRFEGMTLPSAFAALASLARPGSAPPRPRVDGQGRLIVRFFGPSGTYQAYPVAALLNSWAQVQEGKNPQIPPSTFAGKTVMVGLSAVGLYDIKASPLSGVIPGVEIQAAGLDTVLNGLAFGEPSKAFTAVYIILLALLAGLLASVIHRSGPNIAASAGLLILPAAASALGFRAGWWLAHAGPTAGVLLAVIGAAVLNYGFEGKERRFLKGVFRHYLSPQVIDRILENPGLLRLGGEQREVTSFFSDVAGFTSISEALSPSDLVALLNEYLSAMTDIILDAGGTLDKYEGDAIIAFWNAPLDDPGHARRAAAAAVACQRRLAELRPEFERRFGRALGMRIGLNTGPAVVGNMGSSRRFDYTAMGDTINLAARLESAAKQYGVGILAGEETVARAGDAIMSREVDLVRVVGKARPVRIFELIGERGAVPPAAEERLREFGEALTIFRRREWAAGAAAFAALAGDPVAALYADRSRRFAAEPPAEGWDFVFDLKSK
jgi:adenylate cyclase